MKTLEIEFFHDVICSFCYPMSHRMRKLAEAMPELDIKHRSFALAYEEAALIQMFGSLDGAKREIMSHWDHANQNDELHRFNIENMKKETFTFPTSRQPLIAAKAAYLLGGNALYWDAFDALQSALFSNNKNINDDEVIFNLIKTLNLDFDAWLALYQSGAAENAVMDDLKLAQTYGIGSVPSLVVEKKYLVNGALPEAQLKATFEQILNEKYKNEPVLQEINADSEGSCNLTDDGWKCD